MEFTTWAMLGTYAGVLAMVMVITQFTKEWGILAKLPTQVWSWIVAMILMFPAAYFTGQLTIESAALVPVNALLVSLAANGGQTALTNVFGKKE